MRTYDEWRASGPHEDLPRSNGGGKDETCEVCGASVSGVSVARCGDHFSYFPRRPERRGGR